MDWTSPLVWVTAVGLGAIAVVLAIALFPSSPGLVNLWTGAKGDPKLQGLVRALCLYVIPTAAAAAVGLILDWSHPGLVPLIPVAIGLVRWFESLVMAWVPERPPDSDPPGGDPPPLPAPRGGIPNGIEDGL
jgi:hypothetical protein